MRRVVLTTIGLSLMCTPSFADWRPAWDEDWPRRNWRDERPFRSFDPGPEYKEPNTGQTYRNVVQSGGPRPAIAPQAPPIVSFPYAFPAKSIVIDTSGRKLYYVLEGRRAYEYPIAVGREGFTWTGTEAISRKQEWPDWYPPADMRQRDPKLPEKMTGGLRNPLGAMALYLGDTLYRIHGTNDVKSIGQAQSSGCFRMTNPAVLHLASIADAGTAVTVVKSLPPPQISQVREPAAKEPAPPAPPSSENRARPQPRNYRELRVELLGR